MRKLGAAAISLLLSSSALIFSSPSHAISPRVVITTCTDPIVNTQVVLKVNRSTCRPGQLPAIWHAQQSDSPAHNGSGYATIRTCTSKSGFDYQFIKKSCPAYQVTTDYWRSVSVPATPIIQTSTVLGYDVIALNLLAPRQSDSPIAYYLVKNMLTGLVKKVTPIFLNNLYIYGLQEQTSYSFLVAAVSVDGTTSFSTPSQSLLTATRPIVVISVASCAQGGLCTYGDSGPGGGVVFYVDRNGFNCGPNFSPIGSPNMGLCHYLEFALAGASYAPWSNAANYSNSTGGSSDRAIGAGLKNTLAIVNQNGAYSPSNLYIAGAVQAYAGGGVSDWYLPDSSELNVLCQYANGNVVDVNATCARGTLASGFASYLYWSSTENNSVSALRQNLGNGGNAVTFGKSSNSHGVPIRAF
jgi:hypothetical protein